MRSDHHIHHPTQMVPRDCATSGYKRVIHDPTTWRRLQEAYIEMADDEHSDRYARRKKKLPSYSGFSVSVEVRDDGHRGRSIYAAEPIAKGTKVWDDTHLVSFNSPDELKGFLGKLDHDLQCDALLWAYVEKGDGYVALALDPASFVNHGETEEVINLDKDCFAIRDISIGEELLENYTHFIGFDEEEVKWFNRIRGVAWKEAVAASQARSTNEYNLLGAPKAWGVLKGDDVALTWLPAVLVFIVAVWVLKKIFPSNVLKKDKGGI